MALASTFAVVAAPTEPETKASPPPPARTKTVLCLGDSLTAGYGVDLHEAYPALLQKKLDETPDGTVFEVVNAGVSGDTTASGLRRLDWVLRRKADVLVIALGGNDGLRGIAPDVTESNLQGIIDGARKKYPEVKLIIAGMQMPPNMGDEYTRRFKAIFPELAKRNKTDLIPFLLENVGGKPELNLPDQIHPTSAGQKIVAENVWKILKPLIERMGQ